MKAKLLPVFFTEMNDREEKAFNEQLKILSELYGENAEFLPPQPIDRFVEDDSDALLFPQLIGAIFSHKAALKEVRLPVIILTSAFGTVEMWDWEIIAFLREELSLNVFAPYNVDLARCILLAIASQKRMRQAHFLMMQDNPGEGMQANIFKRFYWWEKEISDRIGTTFGVQTVYRSWKEINQVAEKLTDNEAILLWQQRSVPFERLPIGDILKAVKIYMAIKSAVDGIGNVIGVGSNCLNESFYSMTTPCLAWNWIYEYDHIMWACEGDLVSLISQYILHSSLNRPVMMTNIYPFLVGMAALKHEKIDRFPDIDDPDNHALGVHCGYFGLAPQSFCTSWMLRPSVLEIVNEHAVAVDCRFATGPVTMAKLHADMNTLTIIEAEIEDYVQYPGSDCRNGALIRYRHLDGHQVMEKLSSHHAVIIQGHVTPQLLQMARIYHFKTEII